MEKLDQQIANNLLQINAIKFNPANPFQWSSGWKSPIYCDNRKTLSYPSVRNLIKQAFVDLIKSHYNDAEIIAGVATGAIAIGALIADSLNLPFIYIRSQAKQHGLENSIEWDIRKGQKTVVIEDLISTGKSSINAVKALKEKGAVVLGMAAIFSYGFQLAKTDLEQVHCPLYTLCDYHTLIDTALNKGYLKKEDLQELDAWRADPAGWKK